MKAQQEVYYSKATKRKRSSKNKGKELEKEGDIFHYLPMELIINILNQIDDDKIIKENVFLVSKFFHEIVSSNFNNKSLYGRGLRLSAFQKRELNEFKRSAEGFIKNFQISVINRPHEGFLLKVNRYTHLGLLACFLLYLAYYYYSKIKLNANVLEKLIQDQDYNFLSFVIVFEFILPILIISLLPANILWRLKTDARIDNAVFQHSAITLNHFNRLNQFIGEHNILLNNFIAESNITIGQTKMQELLCAIEGKVKELESLADQFDAHLATTRFTAKKYLNQKDLNQLREAHPKLLGYATNMNKFFKEAKKESLFPDLSQEKIQECKKRGKRRI